MTKESSFKRRVRDRMSKTGESYAAARSQLSPKRARVQAARERLAARRPHPTHAPTWANRGRRVGGCNGAGHDSTYSSPGDGPAVR